MHDPRKDEDVTFDKGELLRFAWKKFQGPIIIFIAAIFILIYGVSLLFGGNDDNANDNQQVLDQETNTKTIPSDTKKPVSKSSTEPESKPTCDLGCVDTDSGINTNTVGHTYFGTNITCVVKYDRCINYAQLEEFYCEEGMMQSKIMKCKNGCNLGECNPLSYNK